MVVRRVRAETMVLWSHRFRWGYACTRCGGDPNAGKRCFIVNAPGKANKSCVNGCFDLNILSISLLSTWLYCHARANFFLQVCFSGDLLQVSAIFVSYKFLYPIEIYVLWQF